MNRADFQRISKDRILDAKALLEAGRWSAAYYLAGYAIECALKACIIAQLKKSDEFPEKRFSEQCWTHNLSQLLGIAGLKDQFAVDAAATPELSRNWAVVQEWSESSRYTRQTKFEAQELYDAINDKKQGALQWLKSRW